MVRHPVETLAARRLMIMAAQEALHQMTTVDNRRLRPTTIKGHPMGLRLTSNKGGAPLRLIVSDGAKHYVWKGYCASLQKNEFRWSVLRSPRKNNLGRTG